MSYGSWPAPVRALATALDEAIAAVRSADPDTLAERLTQLEHVEPEIVAVLLGDVLRALVERTYPDGLDADDAEALLAECRAESAALNPSDDAMVLALTGALGIAVADDAPPLPSDVVVRHGVLVIAYLLSVAELRPEPFIESALRELHREQTVEMP